MPPSAADRRRRRTAAAGLLLQQGDAGRRGWTWDTLAELPAWALDAEEAQALAQWAGALWFAPAVPRCIDGARLSAWRALLGDDGVQAVQLAATATGASNLPPAAQLQPALQQRGRALLLGSLPPAWRAPVAAQLHWTEPPEADDAQWAARAQRLQAERRALG